jgi:hypothetical protein
LINEIKRKAAWLRRKELDAGAKIKKRKEYHK